MRVMELKALARDCGLRNYSQMRKAELVALIQNSPPPAPHTRPPPPPPQRRSAYVTLKFDDNGCCKIHSVSDVGNGWIVTNKRYVVMPWKMVTRYGKNMTLAEAVDSIFSRQESEAKERERREREKERIEKKRKESYEVHMKEETERINKLVDWYKFKLDEIREAPVGSRPRKLEKLYQISEKNKHLGVTITRAGIINPVNYPGYPLKLKLHKDEDNNEENPFYDAPRCLLDVNHNVNMIISKRSLELIRDEMKMLLNMSRKLRN